MGGNSDTAVARVPALARGPLFYYRPQHNDHRFLEQYPRRGPFDAAILPSRYLAPYPPGSRSDRLGFTGRELADALHSSGAPYVVDPDTPVLAAVGNSTLPTPRIGAMPHAQVLPLPISPMSFAIDADRQAFARTAATAQVGAAALSAPYFQFERAGDRWQLVNLALIDDVRSIAQGRPLVAFVQAPVESLLAGEVSAAAPSYSDVGVARAFLRVAGFDPRFADSAAVVAYRRALDAFSAEGIEAIADCVGRFGLVAVGAGAAGFTSGSRFFQAVPEQLTYDPSEDIRSDPCLYEVPLRWFAMAHAAARRAAHLLPTCPVTGCGALAAASGSQDLKEHLIHYFTDHVRRVALSGAADVRRSLQQHPQTYTTAWLSAVA
jgi:hypothetical protein